MASWDPFTANKRKVREMDERLIKRFAGHDLGKLKYIGLPASTLVDILAWRQYFCHFDVVERGRPGEEYLYQHILMLNAMKAHIEHLVTLFRGDIDDVLISGHDCFGNSLSYPYDVVSLDYSGGILYKDDGGESKRINSIRALVSRQSESNASFLLLISCNMNNDDHGEISSVIGEIEREFDNLGIEAHDSMVKIRNHERDEVRLKVYVPYLVHQIASSLYQIEHFKPICYEGNNKTRMMHFSAWLKRTPQYAVGKPSRQSLVHIVNLDAFCCVDGELRNGDFGIPKIEHA